MNITLRTTQDAALNPGGFTSVIRRGWDGGKAPENSLFYINNNNTSFTTQDIILDGQSASYTGRAIYVNSGTLTVAGGSTFRNFKMTGINNEDYEGGAILSKVDVLIHTEAGEKVTFSDCTAQWEAGAISLRRKKLTIDNAGTLTFENCSGAIGGAICTDTTNGEVEIKNSGTLEFDNCTCSNSLYGGGAIWTGIFKAEDNSCSISFKNCKATNHGGGAIVANRDSANSDTFVLTNSATGTASFTNCSSTGNYAGGAIRVSNGRVTITSQNTSSPITFENCQATNAGSGGAVYQNGGASMTLTNVTFGEAGTPLKGCTAAIDGGAVYTKAKKAELNNCKFYYAIAGTANSSPKSHGGAVYFDGNNSEEGLYIKGCIFDYCSAQTSASSDSHGNGGAVFIQEGKKLDIEESKFTNCFCRRWGGAVFVEPNGNVADNSVEITNTRFENCYTEIRGGGAVATDSRSTTIEGCIFKNCRDDSSSGGGAVFLHPDGNPGSNASCTISNSTFEDCYTVSGDGGAIYNNHGSVPLTLTNVSINGHTTGTTSLNTDTPNAKKGAAVYSAGNLIIKGTSTIQNCSASDAGGGAVNVASDKTMTFEGNVVIWGNPNSTVGSQKNVVLDQDSNTVIQTTATGLSENAQIGVYVTGSSTTNPFKDHGAAGKPFGTYGKDGDYAYFHNDRLSTTEQDIYGVKGEQANIMYWYEEILPSPTGVSFTVAPYAAMLAAGGAAILVSRLTSRKKRVRA